MPLVGILRIKLHFLHKIRSRPTLYPITGCSRRNFQPKDKNSSASLLNLPNLFKKIIKVTVSGIQTFNLPNRSANNTQQYFDLIVHVVRWWLHFINSLRPSHSNRSFSWCIINYHLHTFRSHHYTPRYYTYKWICCKCSGCVSVGWVVASDSSGPQLESSHRKKLYWMFTVNCTEKRKI